MPHAATPIPNPIGTDGFAFVEFAHPQAEPLAQLFRTMGFTHVAQHKTRPVSLWRQGGVDYLLNADPDGHAGRFAAAHGPSAPAMGFRVKDAPHAFARLVAQGAVPAGPEHGAKTLDVPAIEGIGGSLLYLVDLYGERGEVWDAGFDWLPDVERHPAGFGLQAIDHLTHNVNRGRMDVWSGFYETLFNFRQIRYFDIEGKATGLFSRAMTSPDGEIRIPINESADDKSQIEEYLREYKGEGIQHIACTCNDVYQTVEKLRSAGLNFMPAPPQTYYEALDRRVPDHGEDVSRLKQNGLLLDGAGPDETGRPAKVLIQIFSGNVIGPLFFEFIQRKGEEGFGEGNFRALFESIEEDQIRRGVISLDDAKR